jgi:two-component system chemotaxis sensor kinase CheA
MTENDELRSTYFQESESLLEELADGLDRLFNDDGDHETVHSVFRAVHSIKGGAAAFALADVVRFAHCFENTLDAVRSDYLSLTPRVIAALLAASDRLAVLIESARDNLDVDPSLSDALISGLEELLGETSKKPDEHQVEFVPTMIDINTFEGSDENTFSIWFCPHADLYDVGNEAAFLLRDLTNLGIAMVECDYSDLPDFCEIDPNGAYLSWKVSLTTAVAECAVRDVFEFVLDLCDLEIRLESRERPECATEPSGIDNEAASVTAPATSGWQVMNIESKATTEKSLDLPVAATIRVELHRIDRMINLVGELVINQAMLSQSIRRSNCAEGSDIDLGLEELGTLTRQIQDSVMAIRAQPVKTLFQRMSRIAREAGNECNKTVRLLTEGAATEIDKTVIEKLSDPLTHMIRNAVDHGLETAEKREELGKEPFGTISMTASHTSGRVVIEISDDGAGIDRNRVRQIAIERGLLTEDAILTPSEIDNLIFSPGFSTASKVSGLSGRGVGMDVVKRAIQSLGGRVIIASAPGRGSTFTIDLPLTLAVLDGMVIDIGGQTVVVPISSIIETMRLDVSDFFQLRTGRFVVRVRGKYVPVVDVGSVLGYRPPVQDLEDRVFLLVETVEGSRSALLIDAIRDQRQVVIKGLEENYGQVDGIAAATILGDGRIALILDPAAIVAASTEPHNIIKSTFAMAG